MPRRGSRVRISSSAPIFLESTIDDPPLTPARPDASRARVSQSPPRARRRARSAPFEARPKTCASPASGRARSRARSSSRPTAASASPARRSRRSFPRSTPRRVARARPRAGRAAEDGVLEEDRRAADALEGDGRGAPADRARRLQGLEVQRAIVDVTDDDVERASRRCARSARPSSRSTAPAQLGDVVTLDYAGNDRRRALRRRHRDRQQVTETRRGTASSRGSPRGIVGMTPGETQGRRRRLSRRIRRRPSWPARRRSSTSRCTRSRQLELPALDDEFAKRVSDNETLDELRPTAPAARGDRAQARARGAIGNAAARAAAGRARFSAARKSLVEREIDAIVDDAAQAARSGDTLDDTSRQRTRPKRSCAREYRAEAERASKATLLIEADRQGGEDRGDAGRHRRQSWTRSRASTGSRVARIRKALGR